MIENPKVSFCVLFYNQEKYVEETLDSMLNQDYENYEIIIRDDCSSDNTQNVIKTYLENRNTNIEVKVEYGEKNLGIIKSFNKTLALANGQYIALQGGDDISLPTRLTESMEFILKYKADLIGTDAMVVNEEKQIIYKSFYKRDANGRDIEQEYEQSGKVKLEEDIYFLEDSCGDIARTCLGGFGILFDRKILGYFNSYFPEKARYEDRLLTFLANMNDGCIQYNKALVLYRRTNNNVSMPIDTDKKKIINNMNGLIMMENEVCNIQLEYLLNDGYVNEKYNKKVLINNLEIEYYKNLFQIKVTSDKTIPEKKMFILKKILENPNTKTKTKIKYTVVYFLPFILKNNILKKYYLRLSWFGN